jgi:hypothetical protein
MNSIPFTGITFNVGKSLANTRNFSQKEYLSKFNFNAGANNIIPLKFLLLETKVDKVAPKE